MSLPTLVSFDIDGTLECGEPPGIVSIALVRTAKQRGYLVGSCSDRPIGYQRDLWARLGIAVDFTVLKHRLADLKARFSAVAYYHVGDTDLDAAYAGTPSWDIGRPSRAQSLTSGSRL